MRHAEGEPVLRADALVGRHPVAEHDVAGPRDARRDGEREAAGAAGEVHVGEREHARSSRARARRRSRRVREPSAATTIGPQNSIATAVPSGSRSIAR